MLVVVVWLSWLVTLRMRVIKMILTVAVRVSVRRFAAFLLTSLILLPSLVLVTKVWDAKELSFETFMAACQTCCNSRKIVVKQEAESSSGSANCCRATALIIAHVGIAGGMSKAFSCVCLSVCPCSKRKTAWDINTKLGTCILYSSRSACRYPKVKGQGHMVTKTVTVTRLLMTHAATAVCCCCWRESACQFDCLMSMFSS